MKSLTTPDFWQSYANLPPYIKQQAKKAYRLWMNNTFHSSLHFKKVNLQALEMKQRLLGDSHPAIAGSSIFPDSYLYDRAHVQIAVGRSHW
jgi:hypothetical protein